MYRLGFGCIAGDEGYRVGPYAQSDTLTAENVWQMYQCMARVWVEVSLSLRASQLHSEYCCLRSQADLKRASLLPTFWSVQRSLSQTLRRVSASLTSPSVRET